MSSANSHHNANHQDLATAACDPVAATAIAGKPEDPHMTRNDAARRPENHVIVLFGATGDLARRKLLPGLFHLHAAGLLPREYRVIGSAPASFALTGRQFRAYAREAVERFGMTKPDDPSWTDFEQRLLFAIAEPGNVSDLQAAVRRAEAEIGGSPRRLFHLAIPPEAFTSMLACSATRADPWRDPCDRREAIRYRPGVGADAQPGGTRGLRRVAGVPH